MSSDMILNKTVVQFHLCLKCDQNVCARACLCACVCVCAHLCVCVHVVYACLSFLFLVFSRFPQQPFNCFDLESYSCVRVRVRACVCVHFISYLFPVSPTAFQLL